MCSHPTAENLIASINLSRSEPKKFCHFFRALSQRQRPWTQVAPEKFSRACWERSIRLCLSSLLQQCGLSWLILLLFLSQSSFQQELFLLVQSHCRSGHLWSADLSYCHFLFLVFRCFQHLLGQVFKQKLALGIVILQLLPMKVGDHRHVKSHSLRGMWHKIHISAVHLEAPVRTRQQTPTISHGDEKTQEQIIIFERSHNRRLRSLTSMRIFGNCGNKNRHSYYQLLDVTSIFSRTGKLGCGILEGKSTQGLGTVLICGSTSRQVHHSLHTSYLGTGPSSFLRLRASYPLTIGFSCHVY